MSCTVIAEAGVNHNGDIGLARALVDAAVAAGADIVKFQTFKADRLAARHAPKAEYQNTTTDGAESQHAMLRRLELTPSMHGDLIDYCASSGIRFLSTPFDRESLSFLVNDLQLDTIKLPSGEITNGPLLLDAGRSGCNVILSTGMSTLGEIESALRILAFGMLSPKEDPTEAGLAEVFRSNDCHAALQAKLTLLHCTTEYPSPYESVNLRAMDTLRKAFDLPVGLSDHTCGVSVAMAAIALGASVIEKHFTMDRNLPGPDHKASLEPNELRTLVEGVRAVELAMGDGLKRPHEAEIKNIVIARKSLVAGRNIKAGEIFTPGNLDVKRPGNGVSPLLYWSMLGKAASHDYIQDELISWGDV